jgi:hypothetical protein
MEYFSILIAQLSSVLSWNIHSEIHPRTTKLTYEASKVYVIVVGRH